MICLFEMPEISQLWGAKTLEVVGFTQHMASSLTKKKGGFSVPFQSSQDSTYLEPCSATVSLYLHKRKKRSSFSPLPFLLTTPNLVNSILFLVTRQELPHNITQEWHKSQELCPSAEQDIFSLSDSAKTSMSREFTKFTVQNTQLDHWELSLSYILEDYNIYVLSWQCLFNNHSPNSMLTWWVRELLYSVVWYRE